MMMLRPPPMFEFSYPEKFSPKPPYVQVVYENETLACIPLETAKRYSRFLEENENVVHASPDKELLIVAVPFDELIDLKSVQVVVESMINGGIKIPMNDRFKILRACHLLEVDSLRKAIEQHLIRGCKSRPSLKLECLQEVFDYADDDEFRRQCFSDARNDFVVIAAESTWSKLNADIVRELFSYDELKVAETIVFRAALSWLIDNVCQIPAQVDRLLGMVRFGCMTSDEKFKCLDEARIAGMDDFVKPYLISANWYRSCLELNHPEFADLTEYDRLTHFIGENRRSRSIEAHSAQPRSRRNETGRVVTIDTKPSAFDRASEGKIDGGTWVPRPRSASADAFGTKQSDVETSGLSKKSNLPSIRGSKLPTRIRRVGTPKVKKQVEA